jgi:tetratricopeptide (TPR) repeat protein
MAKSVSQLKNQARREEQRENWSRAIELYGEAIRLSEEAGDVSLDLSLYNRVGDLYRRQGDIDQAVHYYMEAVDQYAEQGLHTGAIALCNKIHRLAPDKVEVFRNLGRLYAATGLVAEARNSFRQYLDHMEEVGDDAARRDARLELARLTGDRDLLLETTGRMAEAGGEEKEKALGTLLELWRDLGDDEEDEELRERIRAIDPEIDLAAGDPASAAGTDSGDESEPTEADGDEAAPPDTVEATAADGEAEEGGAADSDAGAEGEEAWAADLSDVLLDVERSEGLDTTLEDASVSEGAGSPESEMGPEAPEEPAGHEPAAGHDPARAEGTQEAEEAVEAEPGATPDEQGYVDLGERIRRRLESEGASAGREAVSSPSEYDFDDMLVGFRVKVDETAGEADPGAHLELGVALRQMGLLDDAIREFQVATRSADPPLRAFEMLGEAFIEKGFHGVAVRVLTRALHLPGHSDYELLGVLYQLGIAHQTEADHERALDCFERVYSIDIDFRDVAERMEAVRLEA